MIKHLVILSLLLSLVLQAAANTTESAAKPFDIVFYGDTIRFRTDLILPRYVSKPLREDQILQLFDSLKMSGIDFVADSIIAYKKAQQLDDWIFYQVIRATAERFSPKADNYERYTLYKWYLLLQTGYESMLTVTGNKILLYVQSDDEVFEIPVRKHYGKQYVCLNYHDYGHIDFTKEAFAVIRCGVSSSPQSFSYRINRLPQFSESRYVAKKIGFDYYQSRDDYTILVNPDIQKMFQNYPVLNYSYYFSMPMSGVTYRSLIPILKQYLKSMDQIRGVDYLMHFVRYSFGFETDTKQFGKEKRLTPEQTLLYDRSDCEDRAAFFYYLVKEIYNLPMIVLCYPNHVTVAVKLDHKKGRDYITHKGERYYVCEPTSQKKDLKIGQMLPQLRDVPYEVVHEYMTSQ